MHGILTKIHMISQACRSSTSYPVIVKDIQTVQNVGNFSSVFNRKWFLRMGVTKIRTLFFKYGNLFNMAKSEDSMHDPHAQHYSITQ